VGKVDCWEWEKPSHQVNVGDFKIGKYPVTQAQWAAVMGSNPASFAEVTSRPVENVSWNDVQTFIANLNHITGKEYRLPTEAEWEYAARGGDGSINDKYAGGGVIDTVAWYWDNSSNGTQSAGSKAPNELGIYDMSGNVWEWVNDWYGSYTASAKDNPKGPANGTNRVVRGGSWNNAARSCRVSGRDSSPPGNRNYYTGFRLALTP
jgi:formylglycine-generating enzyme required for sulfatase activity